MLAVFRDPAGGVVMNGLSIRNVKVELALCLLAPVVVLILIAAPGYWAIGRMNQAIARRVAVITDIPLLQMHLAKGVKVLAPYRMHNAGKEKGGAIAQQFNQVAAEEGVTIKSVNAERVAAVNGNQAFSDYHVAMSGDGHLNAIVKTMDSLNKPGQCFRVQSLRLRYKAGVSLIYDVDWSYVVRCLTEEKTEQPFGGGSVEPLLTRLIAGNTALEARMKSSRPPLDVSPLDRRTGVTIETVEPVMPDGPVPFRLTGVVRDGRQPMALTDQGIIVEGGVVAGFRITKVADDHVIVVSPQGRKEVVPLYRTEVEP